MGVTDRSKNKSSAYYITLFASIFFLMFISCSYIDTYANENKLVIDPESISGKNDKEGNVLAEYGFPVFTEESMLNMRAIKIQKEKEQIQMVSGLFENKREASTNYDKELKKLIKSGDLFKKVDTGVEMTGDAEINPRDIQKWRMRILAVILMCVMSAAAVRWNRKKYENNCNIRTR